MKASYSRTTSSCLDLSGSEMEGEAWTEGGGGGKKVATCMTLSGEGKQERTTLNLLFLKPNNIRHSAGTTSIRATGKNSKDGKRVSQRGTIPLGANLRIVGTKGGLSDDRINSRTFGRLGVCRSKGKKEERERKAYN